MPISSKIYTKQIQPQVILKNELSTHFKEMLEYYRLTYQDTQLLYKIQCSSNFINQDISQEFILQFYRFINSWKIQTFYYPFKMKNIPYPLLKICHISFSNLKSLNIVGCFIDNIESINWLQSSNLQRLVLQDNKISYLKPLQKTGFKNLIYVDLRENKFNQQELKWLSRSFLEKFMKRKDFSLFLYKPYSDENLGEFAKLIKCTLRDYMNVSKQRFQFESRVKSYLKEKNQI